MRYPLVVDVMLKPAVLDPAGQATQEVLRQMGFAVDALRIGKHITLIVDAPDRETAQALGEEMGQRLLANPVMEEFRVTVMEP